jgi:hypothetical protein
VVEKLEAKNWVALCEAIKPWTSTSSETYMEQQGFIELHGRFGGR